MWEKNMDEGKGETLLDIELRVITCIYSIYI